MIPTREQLEAGRIEGYKTHGYFWSFCELNDCCERCDRIIRFWCNIIRRIHAMQTKRILRICKPKTPKNG